MSRLLSHRYFAESRLTFHVFDRVTHPGSGYAFDCTERPDGTLEYNKPESAARVAALQADPAYTDMGPSTTVHTYAVPAVVECDCGAHVSLFGFTNTCDACGADYNMSGHQLADRAQWGEETGESVADILAADGGI